MRYLIFFSILAVISLNSCNPKQEPQTAKTVSVSILPEKYFVNAIAGDLIHVNVMIPPGASHSSYEPTARQMNLLTKSSAYLKIGYLDFELSWLPRFQGVNPDMKVFDLSSGIEVLRGNCEHGEKNHEVHAGENLSGVDPHIWMSPGNAKIISENILNSLISVFPSDSSAFRANYSVLLKEIELVDSAYKQNSEKLKGLSFIIYHPALAYLARDYNMEQIVLEFDGKEPPPAHIREIVDLARKKNIHAIFVQKQLSIDNSRSLANEINADILRIDPLDEDWNSQMRSILQLLLAGKKTD